MNTRFILFILLAFAPLIGEAYSGTSLNNLSLLSYQVTQDGATEKPYENLYWDNHEKGIYVDIISGIPLFSSRDKYDSDTGWPTFARPIRRHVLTYIPDENLDEVRTEVKAQKSGSHLGHLFDDGPQEYHGVRYCMNSAAMRFVPFANMKKEGYAVYMRFVR